MNGPSGSSTSINVTDAPRSETARPRPLSNEPVVNAARSTSLPTDASKSSTKPAADVGTDVRLLEKNGSCFWWTHADQCVLAILAALVLILLAANWARLTRWGTVAVEVERLKSRQFEYRLDINSATWVEWGQLEGIGDALARRIVADRDADGPFASVDDLRRVKGIGPKTLEKIRPWLSVDSEVTAQNDAGPARSKRRALTGR
jgi:competence protein ComEA